MCTAVVVQHSEIWVTGLEAVVSLVRVSTSSSNRAGSPGRTPILDLATVLRRRAFCPTF